MDNIQAGVHGASEVDKYVKPTEAEVLKSLEEFQDKKLGFMTHFGLFNQLGIVESWALSDELKEDRWSQDGIDWHEDIEQFKEEYRNLNKSFNPARLDPERFANAISSFGFKYALMPTKHHDGFCMWDTEYTDYKVTSKDCPFSTNKNADIFGQLTRAFQANGLMTGAYFSKPDWNCEYYWPDEFKLCGNTNRNVGYDVDENPELWEKFIEFTSNQMLEIVSKYGPIDIMWLDGGQVVPRNNQDIRLSEIAKKMREINPGLLVCDRTCGGENENYITPEQAIPEYYIPVPWESCITLGRPFAYSFDDKYKSAKEVTEIFVNVLCKGGNLALNVGPQPNGKLPQEALCILTEFGDWVQENEKAIFGTRPVAPYFNGTDGLVADKEGNKYLFVKGNKEQTVVPKYLYTKFDYPIAELKYKGEEVKVEKIGSKYKINMPKFEIDRKEPLYYVFEIK